ncbi:MAG: glycosyltransferase family 2 protein [bacterium]|nr:glycosyltransferase family 2 protein [bacterium]
MDPNEFAELLQTPDQYEVSVQICSHNRKDVLKKVLESLKDQTLPAERFEVVLVDDGSTDGTQAMAESLELPYHLTVLRHEKNAGLATARNTGLRACRGHVILIIDDDVIAHPDLLRQHVLTHASYDKIVCNGWVNHVSTPKRPEVPKFTMADISMSFFWTSNVSVKRKHLLEIGGFDEDFKEYGWEDQEVGLRLMALGLKAHNNYKAIGFHVKRTPQRRDIPRMLRQAEAKGRTAALYIKKHNRPRTRLSTGIHPARLAVYHFTRLGDWLQKFCMHRLNRPQLADDAPLTGLDNWCARQLSTIHYFDSVEDSL